MLCRANVARSPLSASLLRAELDRLGRVDLIVRSAGLDAISGSPVADEAAQAGRACGVDLSSHHATRATTDILSRASLVLTMTEAQRASAERLARSTVPYTFTMLELIRLVLSGPEDEPVGTLADLARRAHRARPLVAAAQTPEDIADPAGRPLRHYLALADRLAQLSEVIAGRLTPGPPINSA